MTDATRSAPDDLVARLPEQPHLNIDELPVKEVSRQSSLWTFVARAFTVFAVRAIREATELSDLIDSDDARVRRLGHDF